MVATIPRSEWGARHGDGGGPAPLPFTEWWLHHSVTIAPDLLPPFDDEHRAMRTLEDIGQQRFKQGISYTWPIMPNGRVYQGHSVGTLGAHTGGRNSAARAICFVGNYETTRPTAAQIESAAQLMVQEYRAKRAKTFQLNGGHRDLKATSCPGRFAYEAIPLINARARAIMAGAPPIQEDDMPGFNDQIPWTTPEGKPVSYRFSEWLVWTNWWAGKAAAQAEANGKMIAAQAATIDKLVEVVASGRDDLTADELREAVAGALQDAGAALRAVETVDLPPVEVAP